MKAITPSEATNGKQNNIPDVVIKVVNKMIVGNLEGKEATISQDEIVKELVKNGLDKNEIFEKGWLDFEPVYQKAGWKVDYDKPGYNEDYAATFTFRARTKRPTL